MPDPEEAQPPAPDVSERTADRPEADPRAEQTLRERVQRERRHIEGLTGDDPLRGGIDD